MLHTKFLRNRYTGSLERYCFSIYTIYGHGSHLGQVTSMVLINIHSLVPKKKYMHNLVENDLVVFEKNKFDFSYVNNPGLMSRNDHDHE